MNVINGQSKFLQLTLGNIISMATTIALVVGVYYKIDGRISRLENNSTGIDLSNRVISVERKLDEIGPKINNIGRDVAWLVAREPNAPR